jgi:hypothetical protein
MTDIVDFLSGGLANVGECSWDIKFSHFVEGKVPEFFILDCIFGVVFAVIASS